MNVAATSSPRRAWPPCHRLPWLLAATALFVLVVAGRVVLVSLFSESIPYWDQWDAEGAFLLKPWIEGTWEWNRLFDPHNEHRIAFTRLFALLLFEANDGQWDNLVGAYFNTLLYAGAAVLAFCLLAPGFATRWAKAAFFVLLLALAWLPYGHDNTLVGFQNQFYLMGAFALLAIAVAAHARDSAWLPAKLVAVVVPGLFTMASGLLGAVAAVPVLLARALAGGLRWRNAAATGAVLLAIAAGGYLLVPHLAGHDALKAPDAATWLASFGKSLAWPLSNSYKGLWPLWLPTAVALWHFLRERRATPQQLTALGLSGWVLLQCAAIAYSRGGDMAIVSGRYLDTLALGLVANGWLALQLAEGVARGNGSRLTRMMPAVPLALLTLVLALAFDRHTPADLTGAAHRWRLSVEQTINVRNYLRSGDRSHLDKPRLHIPYPLASRLATLLDDPTLQAILPASVRAPLPLAGSAEGDFRVVERATGTTLGSCAEGGSCAVGTGRWRSEPLQDEALPYLQVAARVAGPTQGVALAWSRADDGAWNELSLAADATWSTFLPAQGVVLRAADASAKSSLHLPAPASAGRLSAMAGRLQQTVRRIAGAPSSPSIWRQRSASPAAGPDAMPLVLESGHAAAFGWNAPRDGRVDALSVYIGNYFGQADGWLDVELCAAAGCARGTMPLRGSLDNADFELPVTPVLRVSEGEALSIRISSRDATHPVALWMYPPTRDSVRVLALPGTDDALAGRTPRLVLSFDD